MKFFGVRFATVRLFFFLTVSLGWLTACNEYKPVARINQAYLYNRNVPLNVQFRVLESGEDLQVFIQIQFKKLEGLKNHLAVWEKYHMLYRVTPGYESNKKLAGDTLHPSERVAPSVNPLVLLVKVPKSEKNRLFELHVKERFSQEDFVFDLPLKKASESGDYQACLFTSKGRIPVFEPYIRTGDTVVLRTFNFGFNGSEMEFHPFNASVALPPMAAIPTSGHDFEESYPVKTEMNELTVFSQSGYYFLPSGKEPKTGFGFMVAPSFFPMVTKPTELIDPMIYISTREERKNLMEASNQKLALDQFWLKISSQKDQARKMIRRYFENIEDANRLFSSHKAGWKTDRGMVMAIYGQPPIVYRNLDSEIWQYDKTVGGENTVFYFTRRPADKDPNVWELKRYNEYDRIWYGVVELWRKGVINR
ncbi:MAG TPA: GWxTD domain-containing protein, partial [Catalimonadaceae bacterium]|nr:GWxTD domain-containing protein [Catalimonadaceae bacterium]